MIVVDTSVLSLAFRRRARQSTEPAVVQMFRRMVEEDQPVSVPGIVLQELLSGVRTEAEFESLSNLMEGFPVVLATPDHHRAAARIANACHRSGIAASAVDCLIAATAVECRASLLTTDEDFDRMAPLCGLRVLKENATDFTKMIP